jgi:hypothetical protein
MYCKQTQKMIENLERLSIHSLEGNGKAAAVVLPNEDSRCASIIRTVVKNLTSQGKAASIVTTGNEVAQLKKYLSRRV